MKNCNIRIAPGSTLNILLGPNISGGGGGGGVDSSPINMLLPSVDPAPLLKAIDEANAGIAAAAPREQSDGLEWSHTLCDGERVNHAAAEKACAALGDGWRLPTRTELSSLVDDTRCDPAIDVERFPDTKSGAYWTSTLHASGPSFAWVVYFGDGNSYGYPRDNSIAFVRAVRSVPAGQFSASLARVSNQ